MKEKYTTKEEFLQALYDDRITDKHRLVAKLMTKYHISANEATKFVETFEPRINEDTKKKGWKK